MDPHRISQFPLSIQQFFHPHGRIKTEALQDHPLNFGEFTGSRRHFLADPFFFWAKLGNATVSKNQRRSVEVRCYHLSGRKKSPFFYPPSHRQEKPLMILCRWALHGACSDTSFTSQAAFAEIPKPAGETGKTQSDCWPFNIAMGNGP